MITVSPRRVRHLVYRCARLHGCSAGVAEPISANVAFCELHYGGAIEAFAVAMNNGDLPDSGFASAPEAFAAARTEAAEHGSAVVTFDAPVPIAAIAQAMWFAASIGLVAVDAPFGAAGTTTIAELRLRRGTLDPAVTEAFAARADAAERSGMVISRMWFSVIEREAERFGGEETH